MDLQKEIKLSDLFGRKKKPTEDGATTEKPKKPAKERKPLFARKDKAEKKAKPPKEPKQRKAGRKRLQPAPGPELPAIPLMRAFNLQPGDDTREKSTRLGLAQVLVALLGLLLIGGLGSFYILTSATVADKRSQVEDLRAQLADLEVPAEEPAKATNGELLSEGQARTLALAGALQGRVAWDRIMREVSLVIPQELYLTQVSAATLPVSAPTTPADPAAAAPANSISMSGAAANQGTVALFLSRLETIPEFQSVDLQSSARDQQSGAYSFAIVATVAPGGAS